MYATLRVDVKTTVSTVDEFESMIVVNLTVELSSGSTFVVDCELTLSTLDNFGNMVDDIVTFDDTSGPINLVDDVERFLSFDEFCRTEIDVTLVVEENWLLRLLVNEEPTDAIIEVSVTGTMIGANLSVEEMDKLRLLKSEVDVFYACIIEMKWRKGLLLNDNKRKNKKVYPSTVSLLAQL